MKALKEVQSNSPENSPRNSPELHPPGDAPGRVGLDDHQVVEAELLEPDDDPPIPLLQLAPALVEALHLPFADRPPNAPISGGDLMAEWITRKRPSLSQRDRGKQGAAAARIVEGRTAGEIGLAVIGIEYVWPFASPNVVKGSEGRLWDLMDLERHFPKAHAAAANHPVIRKVREDAEFDAALERHRTGEEPWSVGATDNRDTPLRYEGESDAEYERRCRAWWASKGVKPPADWQVYRHKPYRGLNDTHLWENGAKKPVVKGAEGGCEAAEKPLPGGRTAAVEKDLEERFS